MRKVDYIIIHCSATKPDMDIGADTIRNWHVKGRGWRDIGYHYVIRRDGSLETGRDLDRDGNIFEEIGAHVRGYNKNSLGLCLVGGVDYKGKPDANFTRWQYNTLETLISDIQNSYPDAKVRGHRDFTNAKACPSFDAEEWWHK
jgi:N-acetylmuramoyl-L-alanine amidase